MTYIPQKSRMFVQAAIAAGACITLTACGEMASAGDAPVITEKQAAKLAERLEGHVPSQPLECVNVSKLGQPVPFGRQTLVYRGHGRTLYRNNLLAPCPGLDDDDIIVTQTRGTRLCKGDGIQAVDRIGGVFAGPVCRLGDFIPYTKPKKPG